MSVAIGHISRSPRNRHPATLHHHMRNVRTGPVQASHAPSGSRPATAEAVQSHRHIGAGAGRVFVGPPDPNRGASAAAPDTTADELVFAAASEPDHDLPLLRHIEAGFRVLVGEIHPDPDPEGWVSLPLGHLRALDRFGIRIQGLSVGAYFDLGSIDDRVPVYPVTKQELRELLQALTCRVPQDLTPEAVNTTGVPST